MPLRPFVPFLAVGALVAGLQSPPRTTMDGVYTAAQANQGRQLFAIACQNCHTPTVHAGPPFKNKWYGRDLGDLFGYMRREMPKNDPGSLSDDEYAQAVAYILRINGMPAGSEALPSDSAQLREIKIDSVKSPTPTGPR